MKKLTVLIFVFCLCATSALAANLQGRGKLSGGGECHVSSSSISNMDNDISFKLDAVCDKTKISGTLAHAAAVGDNASIRYFGELLINGEKKPAEAFVTLTGDGSEAAIACEGQVWDLGKTTLR